MRQSVVDPAAQPVRNRHPNPALTNDAVGWTSNNTSLYQQARVIGTDGVPCFRTVRTATATPAPTSSSARFPAMGDSLPVVPGETIRVSMEVLTAAANRRLLMYVIWVDAAGTAVASNVGQTTTPLIAGAYTRVATLDRVVPETVVGMVVTWRVDTADGTSVVSAGEESFFRRMRIDAPHELYADGDSPGWRWTGEAGNSPSAGYPWALDSAIIRQKVTNLIRNPRHATPGTSWQGVGGSSLLEPDGSIRVTADGLATTRVAATQILDVYHPPGTYTISVDVKRGPLAKYDRLQALLYNSSTQQGGQQTLASLTQEFPDFTRFFVTYSVPHAWNRIYFDFRTGGGFTTAAGDIVGWLRRPMVNAGSLVPYGDGTYPEWSWTGTADASASTGFPYTLEQIAGPPLASVTTPGTSSEPLGLGTHEGRTLYAVFDVIDIQSNLPSYGTLGSLLSPSAGRIGIRATGTGTTNLEARFQPKDGTPYFAPRGGVRTPGRHVAAATLAEGLTSMSFTLDTLSTFTNASILAGSGQDADARLWLGNVTASDRAVVALAYRGEHDDATRKRIMAWLARQYGAPIPAGY